MSGEATPHDDAAKRLVSHSYGLSYDLGNNRGIQVNGTFYVDQSEQQINEQLDLMVRVLDRQRAKHEVEALCAALESMQANLERASGSLERLNAEAAAHTDNGRAKIPATLSAQIENTKADILRIQLDIVKGEKAIEEMKAKAK